MDSFFAVFCVYLNFAIVAPMVTHCGGEEFRTNNRNRLNRHYRQKARLNRNEAKSAISKQSPIDL